LVEHWSPKPGVGSSSLSSRAKKNKDMKLINDIKESYNELVYKVSWPTQKQLVSSSVLVLIASIILAIFIWAVDKIFDLLMQFVYGI
jgi:preprotein translocase subunit SecE